MIGFWLGLLLGAIACLYLHWEWGKALRHNEETLSKWRATIDHAQEVCDMNRVLMAAVKDLADYAPEGVAIDAYMRLVAETKGGEAS